MTFSQEDHNRLLLVTKGNVEAAQWLQLGKWYVHLIDDVIDEDLAELNRERGAQRICEIGIMALQLYTHPFFVRYSQILSGVMLVNTNTYADSVKWESADGWRREFSNWARHGWIDVTLTVAYICGGYDHMRSISEASREVAFELHKDDDLNKQFNTGSCDKLVERLNRIIPDLNYPDEKKNGWKAKV